MTKEAEYLSSVAETVERLFDQGTDDPSAQEIAVAHWGYGRGIMPPDMITGVVHRLPRIRQALRERGHEVFPVSEKYYENGYRDSTELAPDELGQALPCGRGKHQIGIMRLTGESADKARQMFEAWNGLKVRQSVGKVIVTARDVALAVDREYIAEIEAREMFAPLAALQVPAFARPALNGGGSPKELVE